MMIELPIIQVVGTASRFVEYLETEELCSLSKKHQLRKRKSDILVTDMDVTYCYPLSIHKQNPYWCQ